MMKNHKLSSIFLFLQILLIFESYIIQIKAETFHTISIDGIKDDWNIEEEQIHHSSESKWYITWDNSNIFLGLESNLLSSTTSLSNSGRLLLWGKLILDFNEESNLDIKCNMNHDFIRSFPFDPNFFISWNFSNLFATFEWTKDCKHNFNLLKEFRVQVGRTNQFAELFILPSYNLFQTSETLHLFFFGLIVYDGKVMDSISTHSFVDSSHQKINTISFWDFELKSHAIPKTSLLLNVHTLHTRDQLNINITTTSSNQQSSDGETLLLSIILGVTIPVCLLITFFLLFCCCRHRNLETSTSELTMKNLSKIAEINKNSVMESPNKRNSIGSVSFSSVSNEEEEEEEKPYVTASIPHISLLPMDPKKPRASSKIHRVIQIDIEDEEKE